MTKAIEIVRANYTARQTKMEELRSIDEAATGRAYTDDENGKVESLRSDLKGIDDRIQAQLAEEIRSIEITDATASLLGQIKDRDNDGGADERSIAERFRDSDELRSFLDAGARGRGGTFDEAMDFRAVTTVTLGAQSAGALAVPQRLSRIGQSFLDRRTFLLDLLPTIPVTQGVAEYVQDNSPLADMADKAAETAETVAKPQAGPTLDVVTEPTPTIAVWANITRQAAADVPQMMGYLDGRLRYSIKRRADGQAINGSGAGNIVGLLNRSGIVSYQPATDQAYYKTIRHAITLGEQNEAVYEIIVLNPADAETFDLSNDATAGLHAVPNVAGESARTAWGLTQVRSNAIAAGTAMLIDPMAIAVLDRQQVSAYLTDSHASNFTSNILTLLLEARLGLALFDPKGVAEVTFDGIA